MTELSAEEKKFFIDAMGKGMGDAMKDVIPKQIEISEKMRKEYVERLTRIETKLDVMLSLFKGARQ